jgi:hypothetical protein
MMRIEVTMSFSPLEIALAAVCFAVVLAVLVEEFGYGD